MVTIKQVTYPEARAEFFASQRELSANKLVRHVKKMARDDSFGYLSEAQDKARDLGWQINFFNDAERVFSKKNMNDFSTICVCAVRYALGRRTYMPSLVQGFISQNLDLMTENAVTVMIRDIREHGGVNIHHPSAYGNLHDYEGWMSFLDTLEAHYRVMKGSDTPDG